MKIFVSQIPFEGLVLEEEIVPAELDLETESIKFRGNIKVKAEISRITNALSAKVNVRGVLYADCSRCLKQFEQGLNLDIRLNYPIDKATSYIDLNPDIREEIILDYPIKLLCSSDCKGLCVKCGRNLNEGGCNCGLT